MSAVFVKMDSDSDQSINGRIGLLVNGLTPLWEDPYYIWDNLAVVVLNSSGEQIRFSDIPHGVLLDITFNGVVLSTLPGIIGGSLLIQIVE